MDRAWGLEQEFWKELSAGRASDFYARHMTADGYVVLPSGVVDRAALIAGWDTHEPLRRYELSEHRLLLVDGGSVLITYRAAADGEWLPDYRARMSALYTWEGDEWALVFRQHTPDGDHPF